MFPELEVPSRALGLARRLAVWLPPGVRQRSPGAVPVVHLNEGQNLFDTARGSSGTRAFLGC